MNAICKDRGGGERRLVCVAEETPVAFRYNGFAYAVMMATPDDLEDFAAGFSVTEGIIAPACELPDLAILSCHGGITIDISLKGKDLHRYLATRRVRQLRGHTSCGLCGVEDLDDVARPPMRVRAATTVDTDAILPALDTLRQWQPLSRQTRGAHASAWVGPDGKLRMVREDVGRHNSLDKLIGAMVRTHGRADAGFCLITSRCSFEMVQKAVAAGFSALVSAGAPTTHAIRLARAAGLSLYSLARDGQPLLFTSPEYSEANRCPEHAS
ncbi:MAG TPA: formate dehydrogenase accessory sulfurtransferase FdhD [Bradyrhizobium sp.]|nr:formate dehydrogenase accessory sulfurtransferase FdhD [Bradyrhizobium sp.]